MKSKEFWESFEDTGSIYDYLMYRKIQKKEFEMAEDMGIDKKEIPEENIEQQ